MNDKTTVYEKPGHIYMPGSGWVIDPEILMKEAKRRRKEKDPCRLKIMKFIKTKFDNVSYNLTSFSGSYQDFLATQKEELIDASDSTVNHLENLIEIFDALGVAETQFYLDKGKVIIISN
jgi:hypothetical protein